MNKKILKPIAFLLAVFVALSSAGALAAAPTANVSASAVNAKARSLANSLGLEIFFDDTVSRGIGVRVAQETNASVLMDQLKNIEKVFGRYPKEFYKWGGLQSISILRSIYSYEQRSYVEALVATPSTDIIYAAMLVRSEATARTINHELSHVLDNFSLVSDSRWAALNVPGFSYGDFLRGDMLPPGCVSSYCGAYPFEDRAELFSWIMDDAKTKELIALAGHDEVLRAKVTELKYLLDSYIGIGPWSKNIENILKAPATKPLYYVVSSVQGRTGPGNGYPTVGVDTAQPMAVVQQSNTYVKVVVGSAGVYLPRRYITKVAAPKASAAPEAAGEPVASTPAPTQAPGQGVSTLSGAVKLAGLGIEYLAAPEQNALIKFKLPSNQKRIDQILEDIFKVVERDGFAFTKVAVVTGLTVQGKKVANAFYDSVLYVDSAKYGTKSFKAFNAKVLAKYPRVTPAA